MPNEVEDIWLTDYASRKPVVSPNRFDVPHVTEKLFKVHLRINRCGVGRSHTVWAVRESHDIEHWFGRTNTRMEQYPCEFLNKVLGNFPVMREHLPMSPEGCQ